MEDTIKKARDIIENYNGPKLRIMEVCGTHTHEIFRLGIRKILPENIELISGPGCPVCVTPVDFIDEAIYLALEKGVTVCTFGDLIRVPGTKMSLGEARAEGADVKIVYTPLDAVTIARENPEKQVAFLAVGFETTTPAVCLAVKKAKEAQLDNFSVLTANKTMPNAYQALKGSADAFLYPGHVNAITGEAECRKLAEEGVSGVIAGFTAKELLTALAPVSGSESVSVTLVWPRTVFKDSAYWDSIPAIRASISASAAGFPSSSKTELTNSVWISPAGVMVIFPMLANLVPVCAAGISSPISLVIVSA